MHYKKVKSALIKFPFGFRVCTLYEWEKKRKICKRDKKNSPEVVRIETIQYMLPVLYLQYRHSHETQVGQSEDKELVSFKHEGRQRENM